MRRIVIVDVFYVVVRTSQRICILFCILLILFLTIGVWYETLSGDEMRECVLTGGKWDVVKVHEYLINSTLPSKRWEYGCIRS